MHPVSLSDIGVFRPQSIKSIALAMRAGSARNVVGNSFYRIEP